MVITLLHNGMYCYNINKCLHLKVFKCVYRVKVEETRATKEESKESHSIWMNLSTRTCMMIYAGLVGLLVFQAIGRAFLFYTLCLRASVRFVVLTSFKYYY